MSAAVATYRVNYSDYMADVTGNPKPTVKSANTGISHLTSQFSARQNHGTQQTGVMPHYGGGAEKCARCLKSVYLAEKKIGAGRSYHSSCFSCETCNRKLDATTLSEHKGEIYCKTCYTRQFGVHGLISGVTMSTEHTVHEARHSRRSSYGSDLDAPVITHKQNRPRAHSNDNALRGEHSAVQHDELPKMFPWRNDVLPEQHSPPTTNNNINTLDDIVNKQYPRPTSQTGFEKIVESTGSDNHFRPLVYDGENDRHKHIFEEEKSTYNNGTSAIINMPVVSPPKRLDSNHERVDIPALPTKYNVRSRSPSPTTADTYRRQNSREHHTDISDNFSRLTLAENQHEMKTKQFFNDHTTTNIVASENPLLKQIYSHSNSYETNPIRSTTDHQQNHSRDSSRSPTVNSNRSPSPTSGYASSSVHGEPILRDSTSPPAAYVPQHDYLNTRSSNASGIDRQSSISSGHSERIPTTLNEFVSKTTTVPSPIIGGKYSTIAALVKPHRPLSQLNTPNDDDDGFNN